MSKHAEINQFLHESRQIVRAAIQDLPPDFRIYPDWTIKEFLAHFTGWDDAVLILIRAEAAGQKYIPPAFRGADVYNSQTVEERQNLPLEHILREWELNRQLLLDTLNSLTEDQLAKVVTHPWGGEGSIEQLIRDLGWHERSHAEDVQKQRQQG
ncbi:MAG: hypothetical protein OHK0052_19060 [Anaerolineales bacterium]